jgi:hypothetical protein
MAKQQFLGNLRTQPVWLADFLEPNTKLLPIPAKLDAALFANATGVPVTVTASAIATATSVTVAALTPGANPSTTVIAGGNVLIPKGSTIVLGSNKFATLSADAKVGDTTLTVNALPTALAGTETGTWSPTPIKVIQGGQFVGRTFNERAANALWGPGDTTGPDDELYLLVFDAIVDPDTGQAEGELLRHNTAIKENYLPNYANFSANDLIQLRKLYRTILGTN